MNLLTGALVFVASTAMAASVLSPLDTIFGVALVGGEIQLGVEGTTPNVNNWPNAEPPSDVINGLVGGSGEKYLNFIKLNAGVVVTPIAGLTIVTGITLFTANDSPNRDPASFSIWGTNVASSVSIADYAPIVQNIPILTTDPGRNSSLGMTNNSGLVGFANTTPYASYLIVFPTVRDEITANSMQVSEIHLEGTVVPEPGSAALLGAALAGAASIRRRKR